MARVCCRCKGRRWIGYKAQTPCPVCGTTGEDPNWGERTCRLCPTVFEYNRNWNNIPEYCNYCRQPQYKSCKSCSGTIEYKVFWDNIPDYCQSCRAWQEKPCANPHCGGTIRYKKFWDHIPDYCGCKGWYKKTCENSHCGLTMDVNCRWPDPPNYCKSCKGWYEYPCTTGCGANIRAYCGWDHPPKKCKDCGTKGKPGFAVTKRANSGHPDHTTYSWDEHRKSYDSDQGKNKRGQHTSINGQRGGAEDD